MSKQTFFIDGQWQAGSDESWQSFNPANNEVLWEGQAASAEQVNLAVSAARKALPNWMSLSLDQRLDYLQTFGQIVEDNHETLATTISQEVGKPLWEARTEVQAMINKLAISLDAYQSRTGVQEQQLAAGKSLIRHKANGVMGVFGPFNFPAHLPNGHIIPALLAGNTVVYKPSEMTPLVAECITRYWQQAGLPNGVINLIQGGKTTGQALSQSAIDGLLFTGSYQTGRLLHQQFAGHPEKLLALEMGGNNPLLVWDVADRKAAAYHIIQSAFITSGQRCTCARRLILPNTKAGDKLLDELVTMTQSLIIGPYDSQPEPFMGPVISANAAKKCLQTQLELIEGGAESLLEAKQLTPSAAFVSPAIIDVSSCTSRRDEELFGPLLQVIRCPDFSSAINEANNTQYGLSAGLLSDDAKRFERFYQQVNAGLINWNRPLTGAVSQAPFGGIGKSGNHHPSAYYAADYCAYPVASLLSEQLDIPQQTTPGLKVND